MELSYAMLCCYVLCRSCCLLLCCVLWYDVMCALISCVMSGVSRCIVFLPSFVPSFVRSSSFFHFCSPTTDVDMVTSHTRWQRSSSSFSSQHDFPGHFHLCVWWLCAEDRFLSLKPADILSSVQQLLLRIFSRFLVALQLTMQILVRGGRS